MSKCLHSICTGLTVTFKWSLHHLDGLLFDEPGQRRIARLLCGALFGLLLAHVFWSYVLAALDLPPVLANALHLCVFATLGVGYPLSRCVRCWALLICLGFFGRAGRSYMKALVFALIISGPLLNLTQNGREIVRVFSCSAHLTYNLTRTQFELMTAPFRRTLRNMPKNVTQINRAFESITYVVRPIRDELAAENQTTETKSVRRHFRNDQPARDIERNYREKLRRRCHKQVELGEARCRRAFGDAHAKCRNSMPAFVGVILCAPMRATVVCALGGKWAHGRMREVCEPDASVVGPELGDSYVQLLGELDHVQPVRVNVTHLDAADRRAMSARIVRTKAAVFRSIDGKLSALRLYMFVMQKILALFFLRVVWSAVRYRRLYMHDITFDNAYASNYFRRIDERRRRQRLVTLWPPKKIERSALLTVTACRRTRTEFWSMCGQLCVIGLEMLVTLCFVLLDRIVVLGMRIVRRHAFVDFVQSGEHVIDVRVTGVGIVADLMRQAVATFDMHARVKTFADNARCLPLAQALSGWQYAAIYAMYAMAMALVWAEAYTQRGRHCVAAYFYFEREKRRVLHLYNERLKRRRGLMRALRRRVVERVRRGSRMGGGRGVLGWCRGGGCGLCWWLRWCPGCRRRCTICGERESVWRRRKSDAEEVIECSVCGTAYCADCWQELDGVCLVCRVRVERNAGAASGDDDDGDGRRVGGETSAEGDSD